MRVSLCGAGLGAARLSFFDFAELASATGFDGFDFGAQGALDAINELGLEGVQQRLAELNVVPAVFGLDVEWRGSDEKFEEGMAGFAEASCGSGSAQESKGSLHGGRGNR